MKSAPVAMYHRLPKARALGEAAAQLLSMVTS